jgi:hypothetical protein
LHAITFKKEISSVYLRINWITVTFHNEEINTSKTDKIIKSKKEFLDKIKYTAGKHE